MLPQSLLLCSLLPGSPPAVNGRKARASLVPHYFSERDFPWMVRFYEEFLRFKGKKRRDVAAFFQGSLPFQAPEKKRALLYHLLLGESGDDGGRSTGKMARSLRAALFELSARCLRKPDPAEILSAPEVTQPFQRQGTPQANADLLELAFSDLLMERRLIRVPEGLTPERLMLMANLALAQGFVGRSSEVEIFAEGDVRRVVRQAKLRRLICEAVARPGCSNQAPCLRISGPLSLFGHTTVYGRALSELVPLLSWCNLFRLSAITRIRGKDAVFQLRSDDSFLPASEPKRFDSRLEQRFARDFGAEALDWELVREPNAFPLRGPSGAVIFPDFLIRHRRDPLIHFYLEILGYWTQDYLSKKIHGLRAAGIPNLILCVDESLGCGEGDCQAELEKVGAIFFFRGKIQVAGILARMQKGGPGLERSK